MQPNRPLFFWTAIFALSLFNPFFSQGFQVNFQGQKQQGMGCAGSALMQDASALFYNPGAACFALKSEVNVASTPIFANVMYVDSSTQEVFRTKNPVGTPFAAYALIQSKKSHRLAYGISITTPFGSTVQYEDAWIGRFAITRLAMKVFHIQPTVSFKVTDNIGVGAGFVWSPGEVELEKIFLCSSTMAPLAMLRSPVQQGGSGIMWVFFTIPVVFYPQDFLIVRASTWRSKPERSSFKYPVVWRLISPMDR